MALLVAIGLTFIASDPGGEGATHPESRCSPGDRLRLDLERVVETDLLIPPGSLAAASESAFVAIDQTGSVRWFGGDARIDGLDPFRVFSGVATVSAGLVAHADRSLFVLEGSPPHWRELVVPAELTGIRYVTGSRRSESLWVATGSGDSAVIHRLDPHSSDPRRYEADDVWRLPGNWRVSPLGPERVLALATRPPFEIRRLVEGGRTLALGTLAESDRYPQMADTAAPSLAGIVPLNCGRALATVADLRSRARWLFLLDIDEGRVMRTTTLEATMGFFEAWPEEERIFAYRATRGGGEMLVYRWSWAAGDAGG